MNHPVQAGSLSIDGDRARLPSTIFDHAGFRAWARGGAVPENLRIAFIEGEVLIEMSPEATESHNKAKSKVTQVLVGIVDEEDLGEAYSDGVLVTNEAAELSTEPDFVFVSWTSFEAGRVVLVDKATRSDDYVELVGTPDVVVEIVSDSSVRKDRQLLYEAYRRAGVPEYWLIDARSEIEVQIHRLVDGRYEPAAPNGEPQDSGVLSRSFQLVRGRNRAGRYKYSLVVGPSR